MTEPTTYPTEEEIIRWVERTVLLYGGCRSTGLRCAAEFAAAFERGELRVPQSPASPTAAAGA